MVFNLIGIDLPAGIRIKSRASFNIISGDLLLVQINSSADHFTCCQIAIFLPGTEGVFIDRIAKILDVVGCDLFILFSTILPLLSTYNSPRCRGKTNLYRIRIISKDNAPSPPCAAMALIDDDMAEVVLGVMFLPESWHIILCGNIQRLIGRNQNLCVYPGVLRRYNLHIISEGAVEFCHALRPKFIAVADKQDVFQLSRLCQFVKKLHGDDRLSGSCCQR